MTFAPKGLPSSPCPAPGDTARAPCWAPSLKIASGRRPALLGQADGHAGAGVRGRGPARGTGVPIQHRARGQSISRERPGWGLAGRGPRSWGLALTVDSTGPPPGRLLGRPPLGCGQGLAPSSGTCGPFRSGPRLPWGAEPLLEAGTGPRGQMPGPAHTWMPSLVQPGAAFPLNSTPTTRLQPGTARAASLSPYLLPLRSWPHWGDHLALVRPSLWSWSSVSACVCFTCACASPACAHVRACVCV